MLMTVSDIAYGLSISKDTVRRWIREGRMDAIKTSNKHGHRISEDAFYAFLQQNQKYKNKYNLFCTNAVFVGNASYAIDNHINQEVVIANSKSEEVTEEEEEKVTITIKLNGVEYIIHTLKADKIEIDL